MTLKNKLLGALGVFGLTLTLVICTFFWSARGSEAALSTVLADRVVPLRDLKLVADSYAVLIVDSAHKARNGNISFAAAAQNVERGRSDLDAAWKRYSATEIDGDERKVADQAAALIVQANKEVDKLDHILLTGNPADLDQFVINELYPSIDPVSDTIGKLVALQIEIASSTTTTALVSARIALTGAIGLGILGFIVLAGALFIVTRKVVAPIIDLASVISGLAREGGEAKVPHLDRKDEIGEISRSVDAFLASVIAKERDIAAVAAEIQALVTSSLSTGLSALAKGDLNCQIVADFPISYITLKDNFNEALGSLSELIGSITEGTAAISTGSGEIAQASEDLARRTESNAASLEETNAALVQIDTRLKTTARSSTETVARADQAIATVGDGRSTAEEAVQAMDLVSGSAKGIDSVIEGLDKIAFQTRVLAMNAAVEAGRAGDAGRGFAVVADLVSALAMRAEEEAKRARDQLTLTQGYIITAVQAVEKVDGALANISGDVGEVHKLLGTMADDAIVQSSAITQITAAICAMDQSTQQNAAMVEETSAAARNLASEVDILANEARRFKASPTTDARSATVRKPNYVKPSAYTLPTKSSATPHMAHTDEGWASF